MRPNSTLLATAFVASAIALFGPGCRRHGAQQPHGQMPPTAVTVASVEPQEIVEWEEFSGRTAAIENVGVRPRVSGHIDGVKFQSGQLVRKGDALFEIDPRWHKAEFDHRAADYEQAKVKLAIAEREAKRTTQLLANKAISAEEAEQRESRFQEAKAMLLAAVETATPIWNPQPPRVPAGLPADLLERRPDVAQAERDLASANARIGVAKAAFFPVVRLTGSGGFVSGDVESLFSWESRVWSLGPSVSLPIFAGGRNLANLNRSRAAYVEAVAKYRQRVLVAFGDVENSLSGLHFLASQAAAQDRAVASARRAADLATQRYTAGIVSYLDVVDASRGALLAERNQAQVVGQRLIASVQLIKALGGGWDESAIIASRKQF